MSPHGKRHAFEKNFGKEQKFSQKGLFCFQTKTSFFGEVVFLWGFRTVLNDLETRGRRSTINTIIRVVIVPKM